MPPCWFFNDRQQVTTAAKIVEALGRERRVEQIIARIAGVDTLTANLQDLAQMVYLDLLQFPEDKLADLWENEQINFLIIRIVRNNLHSVTSRYYYIIRRFSALSCDLDGLKQKNEDEQ